VAPKVPKIAARTSPPAERVPCDAQIRRDEKNSLRAFGAPLKHLFVFIRRIFRFSAALTAGQVKSDTSRPDCWRALARESTLPFP